MCRHLSTDKTKHSTWHNLLSKMKEHATLEKSEVCKHQLQQPTYCICFNTSTILGSEDNNARLLILESLYIQEHLILTMILNPIP